MRYRTPLLTLLAMAILSGQALFADISTSQALKEYPEKPKMQECVSIPLSSVEEPNWQLANVQVAENGHQAIFEWIHPKEDINDWSELIQIQVLPTQSAQTAAGFAAVFMEILKTQFPNCTAQILSQKVDDVMLEFSLPDATQGESPQHEIARIISNGNGIYRIAFTKKVSQMPAALRTSWLETLGNAKVTKAND